MVSEGENLVVDFISCGKHTEMDMLLRDAELMPDRLWGQIQRAKAEHSPNPETLTAYYVDSTENKRQLKEGIVSDVLQFVDRENPHLVIYLQASGFLVIKIYTYDDPDSAAIVKHLDLECTCVSSYEVHQEAWTCARELFRDSINVMLFYEDGSRGNCIFDVETASHAISSARPDGADRELRLFAKPFPDGCPKVGLATSAGIAGSASASRGTPGPLTEGDRKSHHQLTEHKLVASLGAVSKNMERIERRLSIPSDVQLLQKASQENEARLETALHELEANSQANSRVVHQFHEDINAETEGRRFRDDEKHARAQAVCLRSEARADQLESEMHALELRAEKLQHDSDSQVKFYKQANENMELHSEQLHRNFEHYEGMTESQKQAVHALELHAEKLQKDLERIRGLAKYRKQTADLLEAAAAEKEAEHRKTELENRANVNMLEEQRSELAEAKAVAAAYARDPELSAWVLSSQRDMAGPELALGGDIGGGDITKDTQEFLRKFPGAKQVYRIGKAWCVIGCKDIPVVYTIVLSNDGQKTWPKTATVLHCDGNNLGLLKMPPLTAVQKCREVSIFFDLTVPEASEPCRYTSAWWLVDIATGKPLGPLLVHEVEWIDRVHVD